MKTIIVIFTRGKLSEDKYPEKRYCFVTKSEVKEGDMIQASAYDSPMQVIKVLDINYKYYNKVTGEMSDLYNSTLCFPIKELSVVRSEDKGIIHGVIL